MLYPSDLQDDDEVSDVELDVRRSQLIEDSYSEVSGHRHSCQSGYPICLSLSRQDALLPVVSNGDFNQVEAGCQG